MLTRQISGAPVLSREETVRIMNEMDRLLDELKQTMGSIKKLMGDEAFKPTISPREKVGSL
jgi:hypothetical protein